ncbi:uncharacterized protein BCR38DRAFT_441874 [Pseudomassariella vexata]|uniref:Hemerythrin-like domain-containing protein n=1 Tax=Pseudomassariella vexata TaxID=1141098 RepID=A0A1Y2DNA7_9PEZI|nr:uncharacterized protein BCR38DRAFT_441874 [Pseudomassariella vexata]ORY60659.1 hypothetical protein BCR38DRAFT_441874 [Pseudomassariella vexata]
MATSGTWDNASPLRPLVKNPDQSAGKPWADSPWPLIETPLRTHTINHPALQIANETAHMHNAMLRGMNAIQLQAPHIREMRDIADFLFFTRCWSVWVMDYHLMKSTQMFPAFAEILKNPGTSPTTNLERKLYFLPALQQVLIYAEEVSAQPQSYNGEVLYRLVEELARLFREHLAAEVPLLISLQQMCGPANSVSSEERGSKLLQVFLGCEAEASNGVDRFVVPPMVVRLHDTTYEGGNDWPRLSIMALHAVEDKLSPKYAGAWRFLPCNVWGKPQDLPFA